jgi:hypothetical protein
MPDAREEDREEQLREALRDLLDVTEGQDAEWDSPEEAKRRTAIHERARALLNERST